MSFVGSFLVFFLRFAKVPHLFDTKQVLLGKLQISSKLVLFSMASSFISFLWFALMFYLMSSFIVYSEIWQLNAVMLSFVIVSIHFMVNASRLKAIYTAILIAVMISFVLYISVGITAFSAVTLRFLGIGGMSPAKLYIRTINLADNRVVAKDVTGCIVIITPSQVAVYETKDKNNCLIKHLVNRKTSVLETYELVDVYLRSDVLQISKWKD